MAKFTPSCQTCGGAMRKKTKHDGGIIGELLGLMLFVAGLVLALLTFWTIIGLVVGLLVMAVGYMVGRRQKHNLWVCKQCGAAVARA